jgi:hypothetical protein
LQKLRLLATSLILILACACATPTLLTDLIPVVGGDRQFGGSADDPAALVSVPRGVSLGYEDSIHGKLARNGCHYWSFTGRAGDAVTISLDGGFDTFLALFGSDGRFVASDDDGGVGNASLIDTVVLPTTGDYVIAVQGYSSADYGSYTLRLERSAYGRLSVERATGQLEYGDTIYGDLQDWRGDGWTFFGRAGDLVSVSLRSREFDTYLELYGPDLKRLIRDDDSGDGTNALINRYVLQSSGFFTIVARGYDAGEVGSYALSLD